MYPLVRKFLDLLPWPPERINYCRESATVALVHEDDENAWVKESADIIIDISGDGEKENRRQSKTGGIFRRTRNQGPYPCLD